MVKTAPLILKNASNNVFWAAIVCITRIGTSSADMHQFVGDRRAGETTTRHLSLHHRSRLSAGFQAFGVTDLRVRLDSAATSWFTYREPDEVKIFQTNFLDQMRINRRNRNFQGLINRPH
jgi:hypothetical protein